MKHRQTIMPILFGLVIVACSFLVSAADNTIRFDHDTTITDNVTIPENTTCIISPGVSIFVDGYRTITVLGLLIADAPSKSPILITGKDRPRGSIEKPCWQGLEIRGKGSDAILRNVRIEGAFRTLIYESRPRIDTCTFTGNYTGIYCSGQAAPSVSCCRIYANTFGLVAEVSAPMLLDNIITGNRVGLHLQLGSHAVIGRNTITANTEDIRTEEYLGQTKDAIGVKKVWDLMNQLY